MNDKIQLFTFKEDQLRTLTDQNGEPWFVLKDVMNILGIGNPTETVKNLDEDEFSTTEVIDSIGRKQQALITSEPGLYKLVMRSRKPEAKEFQRWVAHEVLPSIRKHGAYATGTVLQKALDDPDFMIGVLTRLKKEREQRARAEQTIRDQAPKVLFADSVETAKSSILIGELARDLRQNGVQIGQNRLFAWMRDHGYLIARKSESWNEPTQRALEQGLFEVKTRTVNKPDGTALITRTTKVTGKGRITFTQKLLGEHPAESQDSSALGRAKG